MLLTGIIVIVWISSRKWNVGLLAGYMFLIFAVTVLSRTAGPKMSYELVPFWSYSQPQQYKQIILNIIMFIPVGLLGANWKTVGFATGFSTLIELAQLISYRGLFEFDDIIHNSLGTAIGVAVVMIIRKLVVGNK